MLLRILQVTCRVELEKGSLDILQKREGLFLHKLFVSHAHHTDAMLIHIVEKEIFQLEGLHSVGLHAGNQFRCVLLEVTLVRSVFSEDDSALLGNQAIINRHFIKL